jgi:hypothetical protein
MIFDHLVNLRLPAPISPSGALNLAPCLGLELVHLLISAQIGRLSYRKERLDGSMNLQIGIVVLGSDMALRLNGLVKGGCSPVRG